MHWLIRGAMIGLVAASLSASVRAKSPATSGEHAAACELANAIADGARARWPMLLLPEPVTIDRYAERAPLMAPPRGRPSPTPTLALAWGRAPASNLLDVCPELVRRDPRRARLATSAEVAATMTVHSRSGLLVEQYSAPVFNGDFTEALIGLEDRCRGLCGGARVFYYRRVGGAWVLEFAWVVAVS